MSAISENRLLYDQPMPALKIQDVDAGDEKSQVVEFAHSHPNAVEIIKMIRGHSISELIRMQSRLMTDLSYFKDKEKSLDKLQSKKQQIFVARELLEDQNLLEMVDKALKAYKKSLN